jgi:uncharacterized protein YcgI (DUF1989 family)
MRRNGRWPRGRDRASLRADCRLEVLASINSPGGSVTLRAGRDLLLAVTACSLDFHPTNGGVCTEIAVEVLPDPSEA